MRLASAAVAAGFRLFVYETLASTNAEALTLARRGEETSLWVVARAQTAGCGRRGNDWISPPGNLYATLLIADPAPPENAPELSFVAALAVHDAIADCAAALREQLALKWPNDVLCNSKKLAGILIEGEGHTRLAIAIGIGVNCMHHPAETSYPATDLATQGANVSAESLFGALSGAMTRRLAQWRRGSGFRATRADWLDRATGLGGQIRVRLADRELTGAFEALDDSGRLILRRSDGGMQTIAAGDVFPVAANERPAHSAQIGHID
jgi:BirA family transcriptional regulator, biotin operon repressor / biotin---[acetyl-CoA-carboxylase] ligase